MIVKCLCRFIVVHVSFVAVELRSRYWWTYFNITVLSMCMKVPPVSRMLFAIQSFCMLILTFIVLSLRNFEMLLSGLGVGGSGWSKCGIGSVIGRCRSSGRLSHTSIWKFCGTKIFVSWLTKVIFHAFSCKTIINILLCLFSIPEALYRDYPLWQDDMDAALPLDALMRMMEKLTNYKTHYNLTIRVRWCAT